ncbi:hypothetical protein GGF50DRAFT_124908 [Schizophyllum commune]
MNAFAALPHLLPPTSGDKYPAFSGQLICWITVGGICLSEFGVEIDEGKGGPTCATSGRIERDGKDYGETIKRHISLAPQRRVPSISPTLSSRVGSSSVLQQFSIVYHFTRLLDEDALLKSEKSNLGFITSKIWRVSVTGQAEYTGNKAADSINCQMHKRAKNGLEYAIGSGDARSAPIRGVEVDYLDEAPIATFTFRYRSLGKRRSLFIVKDKPLPISRSDTPARAPPSTSSASPSDTSASSSRKRRESALDSPEPENSQDDKVDAVTIVRLEKLQDELQQVYADWLYKKRAVEKYRRKEKRAKLEEVSPASSGEVAEMPEVHE